MLTLLLPALFLLAQDPAVPPPAPAAATAPAAAPAPAAVAPAPQPDGQALSFYSQRFPFHWNQFMPLTVVVDGLKVNSIFFNKRTLTILKSTDFGTRAVVEVTNTASTKRVPGFAVAVFDSENRLVGVASGGPKLGGISPGDTETFDLSFHQVVQRIPRADHFILTVELTN